VISVAAVGADGFRTPYSNFGDRIDLAAPGGDSSNGILSTSVSADGSFDYLFWEGTSMATAHVSGILALMRAIAPNATPEDIDHFIAGSHPAFPDTYITVEKGLSGRDDLYGYGLIDAYSAVQAARLMTETFYVVALKEGSDETVGRAETGFQKGFSYSIEDLPAGSYLVRAGTDRNEDGLICDSEDYCGIFPERVEITTSGELTGLDFELFLEGSR
jgi:subtilisin family serine protease